VLNYDKIALGRFAGHSTREKRREQYSGRSWDLHLARSSGLKSDEGLFLHAKLFLCSGSEGVGLYKT
jgi:hypothetical protein